MTNTFHFKMTRHSTLISIFCDFFPYYSICISWIKIKYKNWPNIKLSHIFRQKWLKTQKISAKFESKTFIFGRLRSTHVRNNRYLNIYIGLSSRRIFYCFSRCAPVSILSPAAPPPKPYPLGPNFLPWQTLQKSTRSWQFRFVESRALLHILHLKHSLWKESSPTFLDSAAYTALSHVGHLICAGALKGILGSFWITRG